MADWEAKKVHDVIQDINDHIVVLPVIQRNLVWDEEKMELLFDSLLKGHSFGGIMVLVEDRGAAPLFAFRRFSKEGELQDSDLPTVLDRNTMLIIDGQQRLQSFYMGLCGGVNGKSLFFNLFSQEDYDFDFARQISDLPQVIKEDGSESMPLWYSVPDLYAQLHRSGDDRYVAREIIANRQIQDEKQKELIYDNVRSFERAIFSQRALGISKVYIKKTDLENERRRMVELFRRLNDGGTRLSSLDLVASTLKGYDYRLEGFLRRDVPRYSDLGFGADEVVKLLFLLQDNFTKEVTNIGKEDADFAVSNSRRILATLEALRQFLKDAELYRYYSDGGRSVIPLYFVAYHIFHKQTPTEKLSDLYVNYDVNNPDFTNLKRWLYLSLLNGVFSRGKGWIPYRTGIYKILNILRQYKNSLFPSDQLFSMYESHPLVFSRELSENRLPRWDMGFVFYLIYGFRSLSGRDIDHIQPKSLLEAAQIPYEKIHSVTNYQLLDEDTNRAAKRAKELKEWIKDWDESLRDQYLAKHLIPSNPELWALAHFDEFIQARASLIIDKIRQAIPAQSVPAQPAKQSVTAEPTGVPTEPDGKEAQIVGAAQLPRSRRDPEAWLTGLADQNGVGAEFRQIIAAARAMGLYARFQNNWWIVQFTPPNKRNLWLIDLSTHLEIWVSSKNLATYLNCPEELVQEKLIVRGQLQPQDVPHWIENLKELLSALNEVNPASPVPTPHPSLKAPKEAPTPVEFDRAALIQNLPPELQNHPTLSDTTTWDDFWIKNRHGGPQWSRRISRELDLAGIYTVSDLALLIMTLGLRISHRHQWGNVYVFNRTLPSGQKPWMRTKHFGAWSWSMVLNRLKQGGFDWEPFLIP